MAFGLAASSPIRYVCLVLDFVGIGWGHKSEVDRSNGHVVPR
jgi:hypothetical protein